MPRKGKVPDTECPVCRDRDLPSRPLTYIPLPNDEAYDAWVCSSDGCSWWILVDKGQNRLPPEDDD